MFPFQKTKGDLMILVLRFAAGSVFLWFGLDKWLHPEAWYAWLPVQFGPFSGFSSSGVMLAVGISEAAIGVLLLLGRQTRIAAAVGGAYLLLASYFVGATDTAVRDGAVIGCCLALFIGVNRTSERQVPPKIVQGVWFVYVFFLFVAGLLFIRQGV